MPAQRPCLLVRLLQARQRKKVAAAARRNTAHMSLRVGIDAWNLPNDRRGIGRYVREIVSAWIRFGTQAVAVELVVPEPNTLLARGRYFRELDARVPVRSRGREQGLDVVWYPWNGMSWVSKVPAVATLHDASLFRIPPDDPQVKEREQRPFLTAASRARRIITDSQFSKEELVRFLAIEAERIDVIPLGVSEVFTRAIPASDPQRYLLVVGHTEPRKGLSTVLEALALLPAALRSSLELKIVGTGAATGETSAYEGVRVTRLGWVEDRALAQLYRDALALVYPSNYEGYGLPIIEAMAAGAPVIAAGTRSSLEAGGSAAAYFPPGDPRALAAAIERLAAAASDEIEDTRAAGRRYAVGRKWEDTARLTLESLARGLEA